MRTTQPDKLRRLIDAGIALTSELSLDSLLQRIVHLGRATEARYAALGVIDPAGRGLERFRHGRRRGTHRAIGDLREDAACSAFSSAR
jgi:hypothetical protein